MVINSQLAPCQQSYRITLDLTVDDDFNPRQIDFNKVFDLSEWESINTHIEELQQFSTEFSTGRPYITLQRASPPPFWVFLYKHYERPVHYTLAATVRHLYKKSLYVAPKLSPQCKKQILIILRKGVSINLGLTLIRTGNPYKWSQIKVE